MSAQLVADLRDLAAAGKIRVPLPCGMVLGVNKNGHPTGSVRVFRAFPTHLYVTLGGEAFDPDFERGICTRVSLRSERHVVTGINTSDAATVGCLAALAREATGEQLLVADPFGVPGGPGWAVIGRGGTLSGPTEGEAWAAAIHAAADAVRGAR